MPLASELISNATAAPASHPTVMKPNAFERLIAGASAQNKTVVLAKNSPKDNKDRLFNECARYVNSLGGKFPHTLTRCGGVVHSVVVTLCNIIWNLDNQMGRFVELAGGTNTIPAFVHSVRMQTLGSMGSKTEFFGMILSKRRLR